LVKKEENWWVKMIEKRYIKKWMVPYIYIIILLMPWNWLWLFLVIANYNRWMLLVWLNGNCEIFFKRYFNWDCRKFIGYLNNCYYSSIGKLINWFIYYPIYRLYFLIVTIRSGILSTKWSSFLEMRWFFFISIYMILYVAMLIKTSSLGWEISELGHGGLIYRIMAQFVGYPGWWFLFLYIDINVFFPLLLYWIDKNYFKAIIFPSTINTYKTSLEFLLHWSHITSMTFDFLWLFIIAVNYKFDGYFFKNYGIITSILPKHWEYIIFSTLTISDPDKSRPYIFYQRGLDMTGEKCYGQSEIVNYIKNFNCDSVYRAVYWFSYFENYYKNNFKKNKDEFDPFNEYGGYTTFFLNMLSSYILLDWILMYNMNKIKFFINKDPAMLIPYRELSYNIIKLWCLVRRNLVNKGYLLTSYEKIPVKFMSNKMYKEYLIQASYLTLQPKDIVWNPSLQYFAKELKKKNNDFVFEYRSFGRKKLPGLKENLFVVQCSIKGIYKEYYLDFTSHDVFKTKILQDKLYEGELYNFEIWKKLFFDSLTTNYSDSDMIIKAEKEYLDYIKEAIHKHCKTRDKNAKYYDDVVSGKIIEKK